MWVFALLLVVVMLSQPWRSYSNLIESEFNGLWEIYNMTNGPYWTYDYTKQHGVAWNFDHREHYNPCHGMLWYGLLCIEFEDYNGFNRLLVANFTGIGNMTGRLPPVISNFTQLLFWVLTDKDLTGDMPAFLDMPSMYLLNMSSNGLTGTIPDSWGNNTALQFLSMSNNQLKGPIPPSLYQISDLMYVSMFNNSLTGTLSSDIGYLKQLISFNAGFNQLRGDIPSCIQYLPKLEQLLLENNYLDGSLPEEFPKSLVALRASDNWLQGTIPLCLCGAGNISIIALDYNVLHGTLSKCLHHLGELNILQVQGNHLTGNLDGVFDPSLQLRLGVIDLSDNSFTGTFPGEIFQLPNLRSIAASKNCFHGRLPEQMCDAGSFLQVITLDGMQSADKCAMQPWDPFHLTRGYLTKLMEGSVPDCVWSFPKIGALSFAGNGFSGTLPGHIDLPDTLLFVSLTHNEMNGTIPSNFLAHSFLDLDFSYNRFYGDIYDFESMDFATEAKDKYLGATLSLEVNRLSGPVPPALVHAYNVDVLSGNHFSCQDNREDLPKHDPQRHDYFCGSFVFDNAIVVFAGVAVILFVFVLMIFGGFRALLPTSATKTDDGTSRRSKSMKRARAIEEPRWMRKAREACVYTVKYCLLVQAWVEKTPEELINELEDADEAMLHDHDPSYRKGREAQMRRFGNYYRYFAALTLVRRLSVMACLVSMVICLPLYTLFYSLSDHNTYYSMYEERYSWISTSVFLTGDVPAATLFVLWTLLLWCVLYCTTRHYNVHLRGEFAKKKSVRGSTLYRRLSFNISTAVHKARESLRESLIMRDSYTQHLRKSAVFQHERDETVAAKHNLSDDPFHNMNSEEPRESSILTMDLDPNDLDEAVNSLEITQFLYLAFIFICIFFLNLSVSIMINAAYLILQNNATMAPGTKIFIQIVMAGFKIFWNMFPVRLMISRLPYSKHSAKLHVSLLLTNTVLAPCLAVAFTDTSCFHDLFFGANSITSSYILAVCVETYQEYCPDSDSYYTACAQYQPTTFTTEFSPSFIYYYTCGSKLLTSYIPVYMYTYTMLLVCAPCIYLVLASLHSPAWPTWFLRMIDGAVRPQDRGKVAFTYLLRATATQAMLTQHLVVLLTFGINSPVLAVIMALAISVDSFTWQMILLRYAKFTDETLPFSPAYQPAGAAQNADKRTKKSTNRSPTKEHSSNSHSQHTVSNSVDERRDLDAISAATDAVQNMDYQNEDHSGEETKQSPHQSSERAGDDVHRGSSVLNAMTTSADIEVPTYSKFTYPVNKEADSVDVNNQGTVAIAVNEVEQQRKLAREEEMSERLNELHTVIGRAWRGLRNTMWLVFYCSLLFNSALLFDLAGDVFGWRHALWVVIATLGVMLVTRIGFVNAVAFLTIKRRQHRSSWLTRLTQNISDICCCACPSFLSCCGPATKLRTNTNHSEGDSLLLGNQLPRNSSQSGNSSQRLSDLSLDCSWLQCCTGWLRRDKEKSAAKYSPVYEHYDDIQ